MIFSLKNLENFQTVPGTQAISATAEVISGSGGYTLSQSVKTYFVGGLRTFLKVNKKGADRLASSNSYALEDYFNAEGVLTASAA